MTSWRGWRSSSSSAPKKSRRCAASIFDRTGQPLAKSMPAESVCINPQKIPDAAMVADLLGRILELDRRKLYDTD